MKLINGIKMFLSNKYTKWYFSIINNSKNRIIDESLIYVERHHINPKCMGGNDDITNISILTAKEHFICHLLLTKMVNDKIHLSKLSYAAWQMSHHRNNKRYKISSGMYQRLKIQLSKNTKGIPKTEEHKIALRKTKSDTSKMGNRKKIAYRKGIKHTEESKLKMSNAKKGKYSGINNSFFGKKHTEESKEKNRQSQLGKKRSKETDIKIKIKRSQTDNLRIDNFYKDIKDLVFTFEIDFSVFGWANRLSKKLNISARQTNKLMQRYYPDFYKNNCFKAPKG